MQEVKFRLTELNGENPERSSKTSNPTMSRTLHENLEKVESTSTALASVPLIADNWSDSKSACFLSVMRGFHD
jgi:hypothetical protein